MSVDDLVEVETAVYPGASLSGSELTVVAPRGDVQVPLAPEGSTLVIDPSPTRAALLARDGAKREGRW